MLANYAPILIFFCVAGALGLVLLSLGFLLGRGSKDEDRLSLEITNPVADNPSQRKHGNQMALANIRQRFELAYGNRANVDVEDSGERFTVRLNFPADDNDQRRAPFESKSPPGGEDE